MNHRYVHHAVPHKKKIVPNCTNTSGDGRSYVKMDIFKKIKLTIIIIFIHMRSITFCERERDKKLKWVKIFKI